jgi:CheY-like chemotaxis protein
MRLVAKPLFLIAEGNEADRLLIEEAFEMYGCCADFHYIFVKDGQEAINYLQGVYLREKKHSALNASLLLVGVKLPRKNEFAVCQEIEAHSVLSTVPIALLVTSLSGEMVEQLYQLGVTSFFFKPSTFEELLDMIGYFHRSAHISRHMEKGYKKV